ncbi:MAG: orotidine-5'-phosphate decarboxylase [Acidobacteriia bacterium]|nr:orotidine-5'-phosphate decarboxylase [Terriglobia bacterium]
MNLEPQPRSRLIVALDFDSAAPALRFAEKVADVVGMFKVGSQLFTAEGPGILGKIAALGTGIFLDLKYHDIPNTVAGAVMAATGLPGLQLVNVHALGGLEMMKAAAQAISATQPLDADRPRLLAVTILTSMDHKAMRETGIAGPPQERVVKLARLARKAGVDGVVASVNEARAIRKACGDKFLIITPGVRPKEAGARKKKDDQARTATPLEAMKAGADYIVVGRPITAADNPRAAAQAILDEMGEA